MDLVAKSQHLMGNLPMTPFSGSCKPTIIVTAERLSVFLSVVLTPVYNWVFQLFGESVSEVGGIHR